MVQWRFWRNRYDLFRLGWRRCCRWQRVLYKRLIMKKAFVILLISAIFYCCKDNPDHPDIVIQPVKKDTIKVKVSDNFGLTNFNTERRKLSADQQLELKT